MGLFASSSLILATAARRGGRMSPAAPRHISVLGREAVEMLAPRDGGIYVDATFGAGGYSRAILDVAGNPGDRHRPRPLRLSPAGSIWSTARTAG